MQPCNKISAKTEYKMECDRDVNNIILWCLSIVIWCLVCVKPRLLGICEKCIFIAWHKIVKEQNTQDAVSMHAM